MDLDLLGTGSGSGEGIYGAKIDIFQFNATYKNRIAAISPTSSSEDKVQMMLKIVSILASIVKTHRDEERSELEEQYTPSDI